MGKNVAVIGSGSFGCVLANVLKTNGHNVILWSNSEEEKKEINEKHYCSKLNGYINDTITCTTNLEEAINGTDYIFMVIPSSAIREVSSNMEAYVTNQKIIVASKGLDGEKVLTEVVDEEINKHTKKCDIGVISGPSHAVQIYDGVTTFFNYSGFTDIKDLLSNEDIKLVYSDDPKGMQIAAALKNRIAINVGKVFGLYNKGVENFDDINFERYSNIISATIVEGLKEIENVGLAMGAKKDTFYDYCGLGDLITTALSVHSRNLKCGIRLGQGKDIEDIKKEIGMTIEGLNALDSAMNIVNKYSLKCLEISSLYNQTHKEMSKTKEEEKNNAFPDDFGGANPGSIVLRMR